MENTLRLLFPLGQLVTTRGALENVARSQMIDCLARHMRGDWGCVDAEDAKTNEEAVRSGSCILSAYPIDPEKHCKGFGDNTLWLIKCGRRKYERS